MPFWLHPNFTISGIWENFPEKILVNLKTAVVVKEPPVSSFTTLEKRRNNA